MLRYDTIWLKWKTALRRTRSVSVRRSIELMFSFKYAIVICNTFVSFCLASLSAASRSAESLSATDFSSATIYNKQKLRLSKSVNFSKHRRQVVNKAHSCITNRIKFALFLLQFHNTSSIFINCQIQVIKLENTNSICNSTDNIFISNKNLVCLI
jgi:hypothetical protein